MIGKTLGITKLQVRWEKAEWVKCFRLRIRSLAARWQSRSTALPVSSEKPKSEVGRAEAASPDRKEMTLTPGTMLGPYEIFAPISA